MTEAGPTISPLLVFALQAAWFAVVWTVLARFVVWPWSQRLSPTECVAAWVAPQMFRVLGLGLLVPNLSPGMPASFAVSTAIGDSLTAVIALCAFVALRRNRAAGLLLAWVCTAIGLLDGMIAVSQAARLGVAAHLAGQWYVPALGVPLMGVAHVGAIMALLRARGAEAGPPQ